MPSMWCATMLILWVKFHGQLISGDNCKTRALIKVPTIQYCIYPISRFLTLAKVATPEMKPRTRNMPAHM